MEEQDLKEILSIFEKELSTAESSPEYLMYLQEKIYKAYTIQKDKNFSKEEFISLIKAEMPRFLESYQGLEQLIKHNLSNVNTNFGISINFQLIDLFEIMKTCSNGEEFEKKKITYFQELKTHPRFSNMDEYIFPNLLEITLEEIQKVYENIITNVDCITPEWSGKMFMIIDSREALYEDGRINENIFNFQYLDKIVNFARANNKKVRMHTLIWHSQFPKLLEKASREEIIEFLDKYFEKLAERYKDVFYAIDVLNEIASDQGGILRESPWKDKLGDYYYIEVLKLARKHFPKTQLIYNEYGEEREEKLPIIVTIVEKIKEAEQQLGYSLIDGIGLQSHYSQYTQDEDINRAYKELSKTGKKLQVSEIDVKEYVLPGENSTSADLKTPLNYEINRVFRTVFGTALSYGVELFNMWGVSRNISWYSGVVNTFLNQNMEISSYLNQAISIYSQSRKKQNNLQNNATINKNKVGDKHV